MKKPDKLPGLSSEHKEALGALMSSKSFPALEKLFAIQEKNIVIEAFSVNSADPHLAVKKSWFEGRLWELRKILKVFDSLKTEE